MHLQIWIEHQLRARHQDAGMQRWVSPRTWPQVLLDLRSGRPGSDPHSSLLSLEETSHQGLRDSGPCASSAQPSVPSEVCGYWLDFHSIPYCLPSLLPALNWCPAVGWGISVLGHISEMCPFSTAGYPGREKAPFPALWRENWLPHRVLPSLNFCPTGHGLGQDGIKLFWET